VVGGTDYGQGSSRERVALAPRFLGLSVVIVNSFARIHWQNLVTFGVLPLDFIDDAEADGKPLRLQHRLSRRQREVMLEGRLIPWLRGRLRDQA
jgi:aconitate hydratase